MELLNFKREKWNGDKQIIHPFAYRDINFRYLYCLGLGVLACGSMKSMMETRPYLDQIVDSMLLHGSYKDKIVIDINNNFDYKINDVFRIFKKKEEMYCFTADLLRISRKSLWAQSYCESIIDIYMQIFHFRQEEKNFFPEFMLLAEKKNKEKAMELYHEFTGEGLQISYQLLQYIFPDFLVEDIYDNVILEYGERLIIDKPAVIQGGITVRTGASLLIEGAPVRLHGSIIVSDGKLSIKNADILVRDCAAEHAFSVTGAALVMIEDTLVDCNIETGMMKQDTGELVVNNSQIKNTGKHRAILFSGRLLTMNGVTFTDCREGGIQNLGSGSMNLDDCSFCDCKAEHGGAVYSDTLGTVNISNSRFENCSARFLGGAVYFAYKKYGQTVANCEMQNCFPEDSGIFNAYGNIE